MSARDDDRWVRGAVSTARIAVESSPCLRITAGTKELMHEHGACIAAVLLEGSEDIKVMGITPDIATLRALQEKLNAYFTRKLLHVPAGTAAAQCNGTTCRAVIYWAVNPATGRKLPVDCEVEGGQTPSETQDPLQRDAFTPSGRADVYDGRGVSHFATCPDVAQFTGKKNRK